MAQKTIKGRIFSERPNKYVLKIQPNKFLWRKLMMKGKKRLKGRICSLKPNKYMLERPTSKGEKGRLKEEVKEDMMSKLPDEILVSIMCCLKMEDAATMSSVSRRWQRIWNTALPIMPDLTFDVDESGWWLCRRVGRCSTIEKINVLNKVVKMHKAPTLDEFSLIASNLNSKHLHHINTWMDFAAKKHVKKLTLNLSGHIYYDPTFVAHNFHSLRELDMNGIVVTENFIRLLFSNSPFLERFSLCSHAFNNNLNIASAPNLKYLKLSFFGILGHLRITSAQNLSTLEITGLVTILNLNISAPNLSNLLLGINRQFFEFHCYSTLFDQIKRLTLVIEDFGEMWDRHPQLPQFSAVEHLELKMCTLWRMPIHRLPDLLKAAPLLNTFSFQDRKLEHPRKDSALKWLGEQIPSKVEVNQNYRCPYLKAVKMDNFTGAQYEVEFLLHLLKHVVSVEKIIIQLMPLTDWKNKKYRLLCLDCAQLLKKRICQMHPRAEVIIT